MDKLTADARSRNMSRVKNKNTGIELTLRKALWKKNVRFRINNNGIIGRPDIVIKTLKIAIFCDGDFWHGRNFSENTVSTHKEFWIEKIQRNRERDLETTIALRDAGWIVLRYWGSDIKKDLDRVVNEIIETISSVKQRKKIMGRQKKDGQFFNCYLRKDILDRLIQYSDETSVPKTAVVEKALNRYLDEVMETKSESKDNIE